MEQAKWKHHLEVATNVAVLLAAMLLISTFVWNYLARTQKPKLQAGFQKGQSLTRLPAINYSSSPQTLLIAISTTCHYCKESLPFYKQLADAQQQRGRATHIVALFPNSENDVQQYVQQNQLNLETIAGANFKALNISSTPTMLLVDKDGKILDFWVGKLSKNDEQQVIMSASEPKT
jgi:thioredoxin-related protein